LFIFFAYFGDARRGATAWFSGIVAFVAVRMFWGLRRLMWFWTTIAVILVYHILLIVLLPWPFEQLSYIQLLPLGFLDLGLAYGIIRLAEKLMDRIQRGDGTAV
jgi:hypothetical protein